MSITVYHVHSVIRFCEQEIDILLCIHNFECSGVCIILYMFTVPGAMSDDLVVVDEAPASDLHLTHVHLLHNIHIPL